MPRTFCGDPEKASGRIAVVVSRYNETITQRLLDGALATLAAHGVPDQQIDVAWVPGAWELPVAANAMAATESYRAVICLGAVIRGETTHDQYINQQVSVSLGEISLRYQLPVLFGLLTCQNLEQAIQRAGGRVGNKGSECALAALEMIDLMTQIGRGSTAVGL
ncbi:MAG: 6,7-dimethyl-8-ribityllumazine synthase [Pirellulaceae bacterium]|nr:6,7-dimethyl-8-ribityllumazine synthase [Planctomycetales bacterium]